MSQKLGWTLGGAITGWLLAAYGFEANAEQTVESLKGIRLMITIYPASGALLAVLFLSIYKLNDKFMMTITDELAERRAE
jgi:GPH family glycoside/pentoside/hexuronide:cation symporter